MENLGSDEEEEEAEAEGLARTPRKRSSPPAETPESTPPAPKKKRVKFSDAAGAGDYVEVSDSPLAGARGDVADDTPEPELAEAKRKAAEVLRASRARRSARHVDEEVVGLEDLMSPPKKVNLTDFMSSPNRTSAGM